MQSINSFQFEQIHRVLMKKIKYRMFKARLEVAWNIDTEPASSDIRTPRRISGNWVAPAPVLRLRCLGTGSGQWGGMGVLTSGRDTVPHVLSCLVSASEASHFTVYFINPPDRNISPLPSLLPPCVLVELSSIIRRVKLNKRLNPNFCLLYLLNK